MNRAAPLVLALLLSPVPAQDPVAPGDAATIAWQTDLDTARKLAAERHAPLFVVLRCER